MENLTIEICEEKIKYWNKKRTELVLERENTTEQYRELYGELAKGITEAKTLKQVKEKLSEQLTKITTL